MGQHIGAPAAPAVAKGDQVYVGTVVGDSDAYVSAPVHASVSGTVTEITQVMLTGGYMATNPNLYNGFERKLSGVWNVGVVVRVPLWNWMEGTYKVRASKIASSIVQLERDEISEKIELQVSQCKFKVKEANRRLTLARKNVENAEENLRCANVGFKEGVLQTTDVMAAQTAWLQAQSQKIDAEIDVRLSQVNLKKALGVLQ